MADGTIDQQSFINAVRTLMHEAYVGPEHPERTWFVDNERDAGFLGLLDRVSAEQASRVVGYPDAASIASHANHIRFALNLVNRAARGEDAFSDADWTGSWNVVAVGELEWARLRAAVRSEYEALVATLETGPQWADPVMMTGAMAVIAHGAWHLGGLRQLVTIVTDAGA
jgi:hypothetical protein